MLEGSIKRVPFLVNVSEHLMEIIEAISYLGDARAYIVGGTVRDGVYNRIYNDNIKSKDLDIEVHGLSEEDLINFLRNYSTDLKVVGRKFGVINFRYENISYDFSLPRRDTKVGTSHTDFEVEIDPFMPVKVASERRDFTCNSMYWDPLTYYLYDYFDGEEDLINHKLRIVSKSFKQDPLRVLIGMQQCARFDLYPDEHSIEVMKETGQSLIDFFDTFSQEQLLELTKNELWHPKGFIELESGKLSPRSAMSWFLSKERLEKEWMKLASMGKKPGIVLKFLEETDWLRFFPELNELKDVEQLSVHHPEIYLMTHVSEVLNETAIISDREELEGEDRAVLVLSALLHDVGKKESMKLVKNSDGTNKTTFHGHEVISHRKSLDFLCNNGFSKDVTEKVSKLVRNHMRSMPFKEGSNSNHSKVIRRLAEDLSPVKIKELAILVEADHNGRPPIPKGIPLEVTNMLAAAHSNSVISRPQKLLISGKHVLPYFNNKSGVHIGEVVLAAKHAQLNNEFSNIEDALKWLENFLKTE